ncbi:acetylhydrolase [soil metagenome]
MRRSIAQCLCWFVLMAGVAQADSTTVSVLREDWRDAARQRTVPVKVDYPKTIGSPLPVVILSHGLGGSREGLAYLGQYFADHGYVVVHIQHAGSDEMLWKGAKPMAALASIKAAVTPAQFLARVQDVTFTLDELARRNDDVHWTLHGKLDLTRIAMAGHSFGAVTTQAMCGELYPGQKNFYDDRIKAGIALSPNPPSGDAKTAFAQIAVPVFHFTGTNDNAPILVSDVTAKQRRVPYDATSSTDQYLVILTDADHISFNGRPAAQFKAHPKDAAWQNIVCRGATAFLDKYLKGSAAQTKYLDGGGFAKDVARLGTFEKKLVKLK